ncbi:ribonucleotide-diphosphate reductase subunit alpha [Pelagibacter phage HTVC120P]|nr:ribonucleotide-diphosphate reductase subunit alpha [Pelagibacter phage HTVC120P]
MDYSKDTNLSEAGLRILKDRYLTDKEQSPQEAFYRVAKVFSDDSEMAERIYGYVSNLWFMFSTPILTNGGTKKGMPISCFLNYVPDSREGLTTHYTENAFLASVGGGIGGFWGHIRSDGTGTSGGSQSSGSIPFMHVVDSEMLAFSQGKTRRGSYATYQDISHPEIEEFLELRKPSGGDIHRKCLNLHHGINISDSFMSIINQCTINPSANDDWQLIDPHTKKVIRTVSAKRLWQKILETRVATGEPYLSFIDTIQKSLPLSQKKLGLKVHHSNLCSEITLPTNEERTAVCCLSSLNLEKYDEWKDDPKFIPDVVRFLDNVLEYFINNATDFLHRAKYSAMRERSIGLGAMGFHSYLQSKNVPFASAIAKGINLKIFKQIKEQALATSKILAEERGEAPDMEGTGLRFAHMLAIAPNASSSIICGSTSPSIEPLRANAYTQKTMSGTHFMRNKFLEKLLKEKGIDTDETWKSIIANRGSVRHLEQLNDWEKDVFATAIEIDQRWIIELAADRQKEICQSQSLNIFVPSDVNIKDLHLLHLSAWKKGIKTLYYCRSEAIKRAEIISTKIERIVRPDGESDCLACE